MAYIRVLATAGLHIRPITLFSEFHHSSKGKIRRLLPCDRQEKLPDAIIAVT